jgi:transcriptional regulator with XRE-family HTH domain
LNQDDLENTTLEIEAGKFIDKAYRDASVREHTRIGVPYQIRALRQQRGWSQKELGNRASKPQNVISRLEDPEYGKLSLQTLFELASAFDVALLVKFVPFSRFRREVSKLSPENLEALPFKEDLSKSAREKSALRNAINEFREAIKTSANVSLPAQTYFTSTGAGALNIPDSERSSLLSGILGGTILQTGAPIRKSRREWNRRARKARMQQRSTRTRSSLSGTQEDTHGSAQGFTLPVGHQSGGAVIPKSA